jgi:hypothetical protein
METLLLSPAVLATGVTALAFVAGLCVTLGLRKSSRRPPKNRSLPRLELEERLHWTRDEARWN